jgi:hypothetical protein
MQYDSSGFVGAPVVPVPVPIKQLKFSALTAPECTVYYTVHL